MVILLPKWFRRHAWNAPRKCLLICSLVPQSREDPTPLTDRRQSPGRRPESIASSRPRADERESVPWLPENAANNCGAPPVLRDRRRSYIRRAIDPTLI